MVTRRQLLQGSLASLLLAGLRLTPAQAANPDVVIVGAGLAGLAAARTLAAKGVPFQLIEARDRIGGRVFTDSKTFDMKVELGAMTLRSADKNPLTAMARMIGMELIEDPQIQTALLDGRVLDREQKDEFETIMREITNKILMIRASYGDKALGTYITPQSELERIAQHLMGPGAYGMELADISSLDVTTQIMTGQGKFIADGMSAFIEKFGGAVPVSLNTIVSGIKWDTTGVQVETNKGTLRAKMVLLTCSTGVLNSGAIKFTPGLPPAKQQVIANMPMGAINKVVLQYLSNTFEQEAFTNMAWITTDGNVINFMFRPFDTDLVVCTLSGKLARALEAQPPEVAIDYVRTQLKHMFGVKKERAYYRGLATQWGNDPYARGAFSMAKPGHAAERALMADGIAERIFFAGEAWHTGWAGQLPAAYLTGVEAARKIMAVP